MHGKDDPEHDAIDQSFRRRKEQIYDKIKWSVLVYCLFTIYRIYENFMNNQYSICGKTRGKTKVSNVFLTYFDYFFRG